MDDKKQIEFLNTFRFLAIVWIVFCHFNYQCFNHFFRQTILSDFCYNPNSWAYWIFYGITGKYALAMLCIISGWLVARKFYRKAINFGKYLFNRYIRLVLPVFVVCTLYVIILALLGKHFTLGTYLKSSLLLGSNGINGHLDCLLDIFLGNLIVALMENLFSNKKYLPILFIPLLLIFYFIDKIWIASILLGGFTYHVCKIIESKKSFKSWFVLPVLFIIWLLPRGEESNFVYLRDSIACALIVTIVYFVPFLQKIWSWNRLNRIKKIGFSLFITHGLVNILFSRYLVQWFKNVNTISNVYVMQLITFLMVFIIDLVIAWIVYYWIENKLYQKIGNWIEKNMN